MKPKIARDCEMRKIFAFGNYLQKNTHCYLIRLNRDYINLRLLLHSKKRRLDKYVWKIMENTQSIYCILRVLTASHWKKWSYCENGKNRLTKMHSYSTNNENPHAATKETSTRSPMDEWELELLDGVKKLSIFSNTNQFVAIFGENKIEKRKKNQILCFRTQYWKMW